VRQLLSHTSGFPDYRDHFFGSRFTSCEHAAAFGVARPLSRAPGTRHIYSNLNFCLLGLLIADVTGRPYEQSVDELLLRPLGITGMRLVATIDPDPNEVVHVSGANRTYMQSLGGAGAWVATPTDMVRILDSLDPTTVGWHPLSPELADLMHTALDVAYPEPEKRRYGLGVIVWPDGSWGHTGTVENTHTMLVRRPDGVTWCILVSGDVPETTERLRDVFDRAIGDAGIALT
jgi:D-alanyl-D-alanine carboxypeptidase